MFDRYVITKMTACQDPYRELELYLEQAREEIGKAIKELEEEDSEYLSTWNETLLPPPQAFRSTTSPDKDTNVCNYSQSTVNRICHDGSLIDVQKTSNEPVSIPANKPFSASFNPESLGCFRKPPYSPNTRRRLWRMHPSLSFPETTKDLRLLGKDSKNCNCSTDTCYSNSLTHKSKSCNSSHQQIRQRSVSDSTVLCRYPDGSKDDSGIPKPPAGDFNLLSVWANNLVLELDKTFSGEFSSASRWSPSSDYSLSPNKADEISETDANAVNFESLHVPETELTDRRQISGQRSLKSMSLSPDSGIEHSCCEITDYVDSGIQSNLCVHNCDLIIPVDVITPPPPEFGDDHVNKFEQYLAKHNSSKSLLKQDTSACFREFHAAVSVLENQEATEVLLSPPQDIKLISCVIAPKTVELEDCPVSRTTCTLNDASHSFNETFRKESYLEGRYISSVFDKNYKLSSTTKIQSNSHISGKRRYTFPRDAERKDDFSKFQRTISDSVVADGNLLGKSEPISWIRRKKNRPPTSADVGVDAKDNQDAVTQTTPVPLSRSSSLTWVTECNCSDWELNNINSGSEESICSNCKKERRNRKSSSSSSLGISSEDDDFVPATTPGSGSSSSLYLSACSGSSDSFELIEDLKETTECSFLFPSCYSESTLRASTLGDIYEEHMTSDSFSIKSTQSNPFLIDSNIVDSQEQPASFPSTLKITKKCPSQPIESTLILSNELNLKSVSAPVLLKQKRRLSKTPSSPLSNENVCNQVPPRSQSAKELNELQAIEACSWLRAAGFPQYAQMYEDNQFPIDITIVEKDHAFLPQESLQSLFRRLNALNKCANMKFVDHKPRKSLHTEDSDDEEQYALSENWEFQCSSRRWSRITATSDGVSELVVPDPQESSKTSSGCFTSGKKYLSPEEAYCSSHDSVFVDEQHSSPDSLRRTSAQKPERIVVSPNFLGDCSPGSSSGSGTLSLVSDDVQEPRSLRRSGSDRVKEGAKALLKRMESLKGKRKKKGRDSKKVESDGSSSSSLTSSPQFRRCQKLPDDSHDLTLQRSHKSDIASYCKDDEDDANAHSDSECHMVLRLSNWKDANPNSKQCKQASFKMTLTPTEASMKSKSLDKRSYVQTDLLAPPLSHSSFSKNQEFGQSDKRGSYYDNICAPIVVFNDFCDESFTCKDSAQMYDDGSQSGGNREPLENEDKGEIIIINNERRDSGVGSSLTRGLRCIHAPWHCFPSHTASDARFISYPIKLADLTAPQMLLLRKLSLLKLTAVMERFSPSSRTGWSWAVPKFIRRIRNPDYKDKNIFGVPLLLILQRTGQPLPLSIQTAIRYLQSTSLDSTGLFRKSGVKSRIQRLKTMNESNPESITYEGQQAYDVADMIKQYFRELPEALLTNKLSETFVSIFQNIPEDSRLEAIQTALFLMPDENREVLQVLLELLYEICQNSDVNQMTATNLAVCFAPSIFHLSSPRSSSSSPRRRKTVGVPDVRELNENKAAYECLSCMVSNYETLFSVSEDMVAQSRIASAAFSQAVTLDEISSFIYDGQMGLKGYIDSCIQVFLKEAKEKYKNYVSFCQYDHVEISYKKLSDGHPLRVWKVSTEVEAPPSVLLNRILRERHLWDPSFMKSKIIAHLSNNTEVFQYSCSQLPPHPHCDYCVLRSWRTDLPRGACILIETSVNHPDGEINQGSVRALALVSRYLIEPCGSGKSRITHLSRMDFRGRSPEWYNRAYGHICTLLLIKLRASFSHACTDGPETKL